MMLDSLIVQPGDGPADLWFEPLTPISFLRRSASVFADHLAVVDGERRLTYGEFGDRAARLAGWLAELGVAPGERVAVLAPNTHVLLEAHFGVPMAGGVLVALNTRLSAAELGFILDHSGCRLLIYDAGMAALARTAVTAANGRIGLFSAGSPSSGAGHDDYEAGLACASPLDRPVVDERDLIALNYTSGTTGRPKGVMYHHRGAYLQALSQVIHSRLDPATVFLWTLPMFHCNGWTYPWAVTAAGGLHLCLSKPDPAAIWHHLRENGVTHFMAAPTVLTMLAADPGANLGPAPRKVEVGTGGAPPSPALLERLGELDISVTHLYGLTETFGPVGICQWRQEWDEESPSARALLKARQGVGNVVAQRIRVVDPLGRDVPTDGSTMGEIAVRGNNVMRGYYRDDDATSAAVPDGWFRTGDLGVAHPDGYVELKDRSKDVIVTGGENVSSVEVEQVIVSHPAVLEAAVVAATDATWGEVPVAFVTLRDGVIVSQDEIIEHVRASLARFKAPKRVLFGPLPKTSTGKVEKYVLRQRAQESGASGRSQGDGGRV